MYKTGYVSRQRQHLLVVVTIAASYTVGCQHEMRWLDKSLIPPRVFVWHS